MLGGAYCAESAAQVITHRKTAQSADACRALDRIAWSKIRTITAPRSTRCQKKQ